jgi:hypothetical protein
MVSLAREPGGPRFVWVHVPAPHAPLVFAPDGSTLAAPLSEFFHLPPDREVYIGNLAHLEDLVIAAAREVRTATRGEAVIVLMADHGSRSTGDIVAMTAADVRERTGILFAAHTPGHPDLFGDTITPVNVLSTLSNTYLGTALPWQPDRQFDLAGTEVPGSDP